MFTGPIMTVNYRGLNAANQMKSTNLLFQTIKDMILKDINKIGRDTGLSGFELVSDIF